VHGTSNEWARVVQREDHDICYDCFRNHFNGSNKSVPASLPERTDCNECLFPFPITTDSFFTITTESLVSIVCKKST